MTIRNLLHLANTYTLAGHTAPPVEIKPYPYLPSEWQTFDTFWNTHRSKFERWAAPWGGDAEQLAETFYKVKLGQVGNGFTDQPGSPDPRRDLQAMAEYFR